jgi:hypothetical protein
MVRCPNRDDPRVAALGCRAIRRRCGTRDLTRSVSEPSTATTHLRIHRNTAKENGRLARSPLVLRVCTCT